MSLAPTSEVVLARHHLQRPELAGYLGIFRAADLEPGLYVVGADGSSDLLSGWGELEPLFRSWFRFPHLYPAAILFRTQDQGGLAPPNAVDVSLEPLLGSPPPALWQNLLPDRHYFQAWSLEAGPGEPNQGLEEFLQVTADWLTHPLFSAPARLKLGQLARRLSLPIRQAMFECRMAVDRSQVDVSLEVASVNGSYLAALPPDWTRLRELAEALDERWPGQITLLGLEFDADAILQPDLSPAVFIGFLPGDSQARLAACVQLLDAPLWRLCEAQVQAFYRSLPEGGQVTYLGLFPGRGQPALRLNVHYPTPESMALHLRGLFPETVSDYSQAVRLAGLQATLVTTFDVSQSGVAPRLGFEIDAEILQQHPELVAELGLCPAKATALEAWPGSLLAAEDTRAWPRGLRSQGESRAALNRHRGHLKLVALPGTALEVKAYPSISHLRFTPQQVEREQLAARHRPQEPKK